MTQWPGRINARDGGDLAVLGAAAGAQADPHQIRTDKLSKDRELAIKLREIVWRDVDPPTLCSRARG